MARDRQRRKSQAVSRLLRPQGDVGGLAEEPVIPLGGVTGPGPQGQDPEAAYQQVRSGLQTLTAQYPEAARLLQQVEEFWRRVGGGGARGAGALEEVEV